MNSTKLNKLMRNTLLLLSIILSFSLYAQNSVNSAGAEATGQGGSLSYSVGQVFQSSSNSSASSVSAGVQQAYEVSVVTKVSETKFNIEASVYPNPTTDFLILSLSDIEENYTYQLTDINGKQLNTGLINNTKTKLDFSSYVSGTYFINIARHANSNIKTFQVIKNK